MLRNLALAFLFSGLLGSLAHAQDRWSWRVVPYMLGVHIDGNASSGRLEDLSIDLDPADILDHLDSGFMIFFEGIHESGWGFVIDYAYMDLSGSGAFASGAGSADASIFQSNLSANIVRRVINRSDLTFDVYGGVRRWEIDVDVNATLIAPLPSVSISESWVDPHFGARVQKRLGDSKWSIAGQADIGGFGVSSDFAWTAIGGFVWHFRENFSVEIGYKAVGVDYETGTRGTSDYFAYDAVTHGPALGLSIQF